MQRPTLTIVVVDGDCCRGNSDVDIVVEDGAEGDHECLGGFKGRIIGDGDGERDGGRTGEVDKSRQRSVIGVICEGVRCKEGCEV